MWTARRHSLGRMAVLVLFLAGFLLIHGASAPDAESGAHRLPFGLVSESGAGPSGLDDHRAEVPGAAGRSVPGQDRPDHDDALAGCLLALTALISISVLLMRARLRGWSIVRDELRAASAPPLGWIVKSWVSPPLAPYSLCVLRT